LVLDLTTVSRCPATYLDGCYCRGGGVPRGESSTRLVRELSEEIGLDTSASNAARVYHDTVTLRTITCRYVVRTDTSAPPLKTADPRSKTSGGSRWTSCPRTVASDGAPDRRIQGGRDRLRRLVTAIGHGRYRRAMQFEASRARRRRSKTKGNQGLQWQGRGHHRGAAGSGYAVARASSGGRQGADRRPDLSVADAAKRLGANAKRIVAIVSTAPIVQAYVKAALDGSGGSTALPTMPASRQVAPTAEYNEEMWTSDRGHLKARSSACAIAAGDDRPGSASIVNMSSTAGVIARRGCRPIRAKHG